MWNRREGRHIRVRTHKSVNTYETAISCEFKNEQIEQWVKDKVIEMSTIVNVYVFVLDLRRLIRKKKPLFKSITIQFYRNKNTKYIAKILGRFSFSINRMTTAWKTNFGYGTTENAYRVWPDLIPGRCATARWDQISSRCRDKRVTSGVYVFHRHSSKVPGERARACQNERPCVSIILTVNINVPFP